ncbi:hypothetical protein GCM10010082_18540 [Kushneria pakistanensis]|uniref:CENP-V/GFA domain-containing protein n=1 Tax=Kushneria pakistanensis TaxID=1508770 RepID=A0ABQ3FIU7_9GAMM|nr:hypothetical protein GCM10010082_18540 [Kushneria pakistanensis]
MHCRECDTYLGRRSDVAFERRRLITGAANEPFDLPHGTVALHTPVALRVIDDSDTPSPATPLKANGTPSPE